MVGISGVAPITAASHRKKNSKPRLPRWSLDTIRLIDLSGSVLGGGKEGPLGPPNETNKGVTPRCNANGPLALTQTRENAAYGRVAYWVWATPMRHRCNCIPASITTIRGGNRRDRNGHESPNPIRHVCRQPSTESPADVGMSQEKLGDKLGITFQQVQKYERGRTASVRPLQAISDILQVPVPFFFEALRRSGAAFGRAARRHRPHRIRFSGRRRGPEARQGVHADRRRGS